MKCSFCEKEEMEKDLLQVPVQENQIGLMCKACRKKYHRETEEDVIEQIKANMKTPMEIVKELDRYVMGHDDVKKTVAVEVYNHFLRVTNRQKIEAEDKEVKKNNIMLTGVSGSGKTLLGQTLAKILGVPFVIANATSLSETGYVGNDVESMLTTLLKQCNMNVNWAKYGIVFIDEVDKLRKTTENLSITKDVSGEGVQQALLKIVEGTVVGVPANGGRIHPQQQLIEVDTTNILFFCAGAFTGIEDITKARLKVSSKKSPIGFRVEANTDHKKEEEDLMCLLRESIDIDDLLKYGIITEFLGRFPVLCNLRPLTLDDLVRILNAKNGLVEEYQTLFELQEKQLNFSADALNTVADLAIKSNVGARGLRSIVTKFMRDLQFFAPSENKDIYTIEPGYVNKYFKEAV
jgi:endopeptidase Clp ATP-binding regulatory subunit (clpX)